MTPEEMIKLQVGDRVNVRDGRTNRVLNKMFVLAGGIDSEGPTQSPWLAVGPHEGVAEILGDGDMVMLGDEPVAADDLQTGQEITIENHPFVVQATRGSTSHRGHEHVIVTPPKTAGAALYQFVAASQARRLTALESEAVEEESVPHGE